MLTRSLRNAVSGSFAKRAILPGAGLGSALLFAGCIETETPPEARSIILGATFSGTGRFAQLGTEMFNGYSLATRMLNESGGIAGHRVLLVIRDDESDAATAESFYAEYVASGNFDALLGPYSSPLTEAVVGLTDTLDIPLVAPMAADPGIWAGQSRQWSVQMLNPGPTYLQGSVELAAANGATTAALVYEESQFPISVAEGVRDAARTHGMDIVLDRSYPAGQADHEGLATAAKEAGAQLFIGGGYYDDAVAFTRAAGEADYTPMLLSLSLGPAQSGFADELGDLARCVAGNAAWLPTIRTRGFIVDSETFVRRYELVYGHTPGYYAAGGFGAVELVAEAIDAAIDGGHGVDPIAIRDRLFSMETETVLGPFKVYPLGDPGAGGQQALKGLQVQWQDDGSGGLVRRIVHPEGVADAEVCLGG